ncbi:hypothetical protein LSH36_529g01069 [Paralvinella palmiformis]|uniref:Glutathione peroxidase n=1 Tax=Paralvinella palmiformis TaxID=53620 RepID=A0AAD9MW44_9ANNE|nr:hypothetical protein LSH36_529g01069 [Paralvinella palmiformis]
MAVFLKSLLSILTVISGLTVPLTVGSRCSSDEKKVNKVFCYHSLQSNQSLYSHTIKDLHSESNISWSEFKGRVQEPGSNGTEILNTLRYVRPGGGFIPNFQLTEKSMCPPTWNSFAPKRRLHYEEMKANDVRWNFEKFLLDRRGKPVMRYSETFYPGDITSDVQHLLINSINPV